MLCVNNLTIRYGSLKVVENLSFSVEEGQCLMIAGPNGAGKSTALNAISQGVDYTGEILFEGQNVKSMKAAARARCIGVLSQNHYVGYSFTVEEVVKLGRYAFSSGFLKNKDKEDQKAVDEALFLTGMEGQRKQSVLTLSGGELQRTFLAQMLAQNPRLLLLDEPTNHLDLIYQKQMFELIQEWLKTPGRSVVAVVHDLSLAKAYGTHALLLDHGTCVAKGKTEEVLSSEYLNQVYNMDVCAWMQKMYAQWEETK